MSTSTTRPQRNQIVEEIAQNQFKYEKIFEEQAVELRKDPAARDSAYERVSRSMKTVKPGQQWVPKQADREAYMNQMDEICNKEPISFDDRMEISFAAYAAIMCILMVDIAQQESDVQLEIMKRSTQLNTEMVQHLLPMQEGVSGLGTPSEPLKPLTRHADTCPRRQVTADDLESFQRSPFQVVDRRFILHPNESEQDGGNILYKIVGVRRSKTEGTWYQVQPEGTVDSIELSAQEMMEVFKDSVLLIDSENDLTTDHFGIAGIMRSLSSTDLSS